jgi:Uma2 family endonuclease
MGMAQVIAHRWTPEEVMALPDDGQRHECVGGELLVTPAPNGGHQSVCALLFRSLDRAVVRTREFRLLFGPADLRLEPGSVVQPDLFVVSRADLARSKPNWEGLTRLRLAVEVLSPGSMRHDRGPKRALYQRTDVAEYWIVDPDGRVIERWLKGETVARVEHTTFDWMLAQDTEAVEFNVAALFADALDPD